MASTTSPNMFLTIPSVGSQQGPDYALNVNADLSLIDQHDHSPGKGVPISSAGINVSADFTLNGHDLTNVGGVAFTAFTSNPSTVQFLYVAPGIETPVTEDLWFNDGNGNQVQITSNGTVNATIASIPGESYAAGTFFWKQGAGSTTPANFDIGSITIRPNVAATTNGVRLVPPSAIVSQYDIALPLLPSVNSFMAIDNSGIITSTIPIANGITASNIANGTITTTQISPTAGIVGTQLADHTITLQQLNTSVLTWNQTTLTTTTPSFQVRIATTANGTLATAFANGQTVDGVVLATGNVILLKNQTASTEDGVYTVNASGAPTRSTSYNTFTQLNYAGVHVTAGTANTNTNWFQNNILTSLSDAQTWSKSQTFAFIVPSNVNELIILASGGGGGGGGAGSSGSTSIWGGGGGAGATPQRVTALVVPGETISITVGAGGVSGAGATNASGVTGGSGTNTRIIGSLINYTILGGIGGVGGNSTTAGLGGTTYNSTSIGGMTPVTPGGNGSLASGGVVPAGQNGQGNTFWPVGGTGGTGGTSVGPAGGGGGAGFGVGGNGANGLTGSTPPPPTSPIDGGGGGGGAGFNNTTALQGSGATGGTGKAIITWLGLPS